MQANQKLEFTQVPEGAADNILSAKVGMRPNKVVGHVGVAAEMLQAAPLAVDSDCWRWPSTPR